MGIFRNIAMVLQAGDKIPSATFKTMKEGRPTDITTDEVFNGKKVVLFSVPGAFTPTCSNEHCPGFKKNFAAIREKGVDTIACTAVNDAFVMQAWGEHQRVEDQMLMLADGCGDFVKAADMVLDLSGYGMGVRGKRFALIVDNGTITYCGVDDQGLSLSSAESVLANL